jgi:hypothetical protein
VATRRCCLARPPHRWRSSLVARCSCRIT